MIKLKHITLGEKCIMKRVAIIFAFFYLTMLYPVHKSFEITIKNTTDQTLKVALESRLDMYYTHKMKNLTSFIPNRGIIKTFILLPGQQKDLSISPKQTRAALLPHKESLTLGDFGSTHKTIRGTLVINTMDQLYDFTEQLEKAENLLLTLSDEGLTIQTTALFN
jgi:hypothetical protein